MTKLLDQAVEVVRRMPPAAQDDIARALLGMAEDDAPADIEPEYFEAILEGETQAKRGAFAVGSASEIVAAAFRRHQR